MSIEFDLNATLRDQTKLGTSASRRMRIAQQVPAVIYGAGKPNVFISIAYNTLLKALKKPGFHSQIIQLMVNDKKEQVVLRALQLEPGRPQVLHADFFRVSRKEKLVIKVPLHFVGAEVAPGVKQSKGTVAHSMTEVEVKCLPADLPASLTVDISHLAVGQVLHLTDLILPKGVELTALAQGVEEHDLSVVSIQPPAVETEEADEAKVVEDVEQAATDETNKDG